MLLAGPPGLGKTTLAQIVREELGVGLRTVAGPGARAKGDIAAILTALEPRDVLFVDEIHRLNRADRGDPLPGARGLPARHRRSGRAPAARTLTLDLPPFTLVGATTRTGLLTTPLRDRFGMTFRLGYYDPGQLATIVRRSARILDVEIDDDAAEEIASRSRGTPADREPDPPARARRRARCATPARSRPTSRARRSSCSRSTSRGSSASTASCSRRSRTSSAAARSGCRRSRSSLGEEPDTIEDVYEPYLLQLGFLQRTPRGRVITELGRAHLGAARDDGSLF